MCLHSCSRLHGKEDEEDVCPGLASATSLKLCLGWQMRTGSDAMPDAAGGEGGHGAAKPDGVIHRYISNFRESLELVARGDVSAKERSRSRERNPVGVKGAKP